MSLEFAGGRRPGVITSSPIFCIDSYHFCGILMLVLADQQLDNLQASQTKNFLPKLLYFKSCGKLSLSVQFTIYTFQTIQSLWTKTMIIGLVITFIQPKFAQILNHNLRVCICIQISTANPKTLSKASVVTNQINNSPKTRTSPTSGSGRNNLIS